MKQYFLATALLFSACSQSETPKQGHPLILAHVHAFNAQDTQAMAKVEHADIEWYSVNGSEISVEVSGRDNLTKYMEGYFKSPTKTTGSLRDWSINGDYVAVTETAKWQTASGEDKSQSSLTVYHIEEDLIRRVWYYPAVGN